MAMEGFLTSIYAGDDILRPTFFELVAQAQLVDALRPAVRFVIGVYAERAPARLLPVVARWEALYNLFLLLLEGYHLRSQGACFAEHFFGLRRQEAAPRRRLSPLEEMELERRRLAAPNLTRRQQLLSLLSVVVLPCVRLRCEARFREAEAALPPTRSSQQRLWLALYPWVHATGSSLSLVYQVLYLLRQTDFWSPVLHLLNLRLVRHFPEPPDPGSAAAKGRLLRLWDAAGTLGSMSLWGLMYLLQFMQWWYQREHLLQPFRPRKVPPPPPLRPPYQQALPAPAPGRAEAGGGGPRLVLLPQDRTVCALCHRVRRNPAVSSGGYVFCYTCLLPHVQRHGSCPVTGVPMALEQVRRIRDESDDATGL